MMVMHKEYDKKNEPKSFLLITSLWPQTFQGYFCSFCTNIVLPCTPFCLMSPPHQNASSYLLSGSSLVQAFCRLFFFLRVVVSLFKYLAAPSRIGPTHLISILRLVITCSSRYGKPLGFQPSARWHKYQITTLYTYHICNMVTFCNICSSQETSHKVRGPTSRDSLGGIQVSKQCVTDLKPH